METRHSDLELYLNGIYRIYSKINGKVSFYRPSSQKLDFEIPISLSSPHLLIPKSNLASGLWDISIDWEYDGVKYLNKDSFRME